MRTTLTVMLGWLFFSLGQYDENGVFTLSIQSDHSLTYETCESRRDAAEVSGWDVTRTCLRGLTLNEREIERDMTTRPTLMIVPARP